MYFANSITWCARPVNKVKDCVTDTKCEEHILATLLVLVMISPFSVREIFYLSKEQYKPNYNKICSRVLSLVG